MLDTQHQQNLCLSSRLQIREAEWGAGGGGDVTGSTQHYGVHEASMIESKQIKPRIGDRSTAMPTVPRQRDRNTANTHEYRGHNGAGGEVKTRPALPLNEQPCRKR